MGFLATKDGERGEPAVRTVPMPSDANANGDIFGGWLLSQMDIAGGIIATRQAKGRVVTVTIDAMTFDRPIQVGDLVSIYGHVSATGTSSITVEMETIVQRQYSEEEIKVTGGQFKFVAIDSEGRPRPLPGSSNSS